MSNIKARSQRLGRGLNSLMGGSAVPLDPQPPTENKNDTASETRPSDSVRSIPIDAIKPNVHQPRQHFDQGALKRLAHSIRQVGLLQPIVVQPNADGSYTIVVGERRWRAAKLAGLRDLPAMLRTVDDGQSAEWALIENLQREDLNPIERAQGFEHLINEFSLSHEDVSKHVQVERSTVTNALRLLNLDPDVQVLVRQGILSGGHAKALASISDSNFQLDLAKKAVQRDWSVRQLEAAVRRERQSPQSSTKQHPRRKSTHIADLERQISEQLGTKVHINSTQSKESGTLSIEYFDFDHFDGLMKRMDIEIK